MAIVNKIFNKGISHQLFSYNAVTAITYHAVSETVDTIGDFREYYSAGTYTKEACTTGSTTKGGGTWVVIESRDSSGNIKIGDPTNYAKFEADGTLVLKGDATGWEDVGKEAVNLRQVGTGVSINSTESTVEFNTISNLSDYMFVNVQLNHSWEVGSVIYPHLHTESTSTLVPNWLFQYRWQIRGGNKVTTWTNLACNTALFTLDGVVNQQVIAPAGITPPVGAGISDIIQFRILRDNANNSGVFSGADPLNAVASIVSFDVHIKIDTPQGSRTMSAK